MKEGIIFFIFLTMLVTRADASPDYNVLQYGAKGDGHTLCTSAFQKAVDACSKAGGGKIVFPKGKYLTGPVFLKSNVHMEIEAGAVLLFDDSILQTPTIDGSWEGIGRKVYASLFTGKNLENITITGRGTLEGQGKTWWTAYSQTEELRKKMDIITREPENPSGSPLPFPRPRMINLYNCKNILISDLIILNSPSWTIHPVYCENITIQNVSIIQPYDSPNTDGINPESCKYVRILNCYVDCGDDCITLKSGYNEHGRKVGIPCENIVIANCTLGHGRSAIGIGSEMSGGVKNVIVSNCIFKATLRGIRLKTARGRGGVVEDINISDIVMDSVTEGISLDMYYDSRNEEPAAITEETPYFRNIFISNIAGSHVKEAMNLSGLPESPLKGIRFQNIHINSTKGVRCRFATEIEFKDCRINAEDGPAFNFRKSSIVRLNNVENKIAKQGMPIVNIELGNDVTVLNSRLYAGQDIFIRATGTQEIKYGNNFFPASAIQVNEEK